jgi:hypothetical protein
MKSARDEGAGAVPLRGRQGNARQVEHVEDVGVGELVAEREADDVELFQGMTRLQTEEGESGGAHLRLHIRPGGIDTLRQEIRLGVEDIVEDGQPQVGHADVVDVGIGQGKAYRCGLPVLHDGVPLAAGIAGGPAHPGQDAI